MGRTKVATKKTWTGNSLHCQRQCRITFNQHNFLLLWWNTHTTAVSLREIRNLGGKGNFFFSDVLLELKLSIHLLGHIFQHFLNVSVMKSKTEDMLFLLGTDEVLLRLHPIMFLLQTDAVATTTATVSAQLSVCYRANSCCERSCSTAAFLLITFKDCIVSVNLLLTEVCWLWNRQ